MKRKYIHIYIIAIIGLCITTACHHSSAPAYQEVADPQLMHPRELCFSTGSGTDTIELAIVSNAAWSVTCQADWLQLSDTEGFGSGYIYAYVDANICSSPRNAEVTVTLKQIQSKRFSYTVQQESYTSLLARAGYEKGAGFAYDITADYCKGMTWQIFDVQALDYYQYQIDPETGAPFRYGTLVTDNAEVYNEEQFLSGNTLEEINTQMSASATIDLSVHVADLKVSGNVHLSEWEKLETIYGVKRAKRIVFVRDIQYSNCLAAAKAGLTGVFTPSFRRDWEALEACNAKNGASLQQCQKFIDKWGIAFVCRALMGGTFDFEMEVEKSAMGSEITIEAALEAEIAGGVFNANGNVEWANILEKIQNSFSADLHISGGDVQLVSILTNREEPLSIDDYKNWVYSITTGFDANDPATNNAVLIDIKIASMANLFTGQTRHNMEEVISNYVNL